MTKIRVISALIAVISLVVIIKFGGYAGIAITAFFISFVALNEYGRMAFEGPHYKIARIYFIILGLVAFSVSIFRNDLLLHSFVLSTLLIFVLFLFLARNETLPLEELVNKMGLSMLGILYAGVCPVYLCLLARLSERLEWFVFALAVVFAGDTTAYFAGRKWGAHTLFHRISPNKSVEGAVASLAAGMVTGFIVTKLLFPQGHVLSMVILAALTSIVGQLGDLCESMIKRSFHTKDSGHIMPGHGGLLDRMDGILFGAPLVYIYAHYVVMP